MGIKFLCVATLFPVWLKLCSMFTCLLSITSQTVFHCTLLYITVLTPMQWNLFCTHNLGSCICTMYIYMYTLHIFSTFSSILQEQTLTYNKIGRCKISTEFQSNNEVMFMFIPETTLPAEILFELWFCFIGKLSKMKFSVR